MDNLEEVVAKINAVFARALVQPLSFTLYSRSFTLCFQLYALSPTPYALRRSPCTLYRTPYIEALSLSVLPEAGRGFKTVITRVPRRCSTSCGWS